MLSRYLAVSLCAPLISAAEAAAGSTEAGAYGPGGFGGGGWGGGKPGGGMPWGGPPGGGMPWGGAPGGGWGGPFGGAGWGPPGKTRSFTLCLAKETATATLSTGIGGERMSLSAKPALGWRRQSQGIP